MKVKSREEYLDIYRDYWIECQKITHDMMEPEDDFEILFEEILQNNIPSADVLAGYYLEIHGENAYNAWKDNTMGIPKDDMDEETECILQTLFPENS